MTKNNINNLQSEQGVSFYIISGIIAFISFYFGGDIGKLIGFVCILPIVAVLVEPVFSFLTRLLVKQEKNVNGSVEGYYLNEDVATYKVDGTRLVCERKKNGGNLINIVVSLDKKEVAEEFLFNDFQNSKTVKKYEYKIDEEKQTLERRLVYKATYENETSNPIEFVVGGKFDKKKSMISKGCKNFSDIDEDLQADLNEILKNEEGETHWGDFSENEYLLEVFTIYVSLKSLGEVGATTYLNNYKDGLNAKLISSKIGTDNFLEVEHFVDFLINNNFS